MRTLKKQAFNDDLKTFHTNVVGVTFNNDNNISRQTLLKKFKTGDKVTLLENIFEGEPIVEVLNKKGEKLGHINKEFKDEVLKLIHNKRIVKIETKKIGEDKDILGCTLTIYYE